MADYNWHARMIHPLEWDSSPGHYDLMIEGTHTFHGRTYKDPVFSYHNDSNNVGTLYVFNASYSPAAYRSFTPYKLYHYNGASTCTEAQLNALGAYISNMTDTDNIATKALVTTSGAVMGYASVYSITNGYKNYSKSERNCFKLLGLWTKKLGHNHIYNYSQKDYSNYTSTAMIENPDKLKLWDYKKLVPIS